MHITLSRALWMSSVSAALHAAVRAGREIKDMVDGSGYA